MEKNQRANFYDNSSQVELKIFIKKTAIYKY